MGPAKPKRERPTDLLTYSLGATSSATGLSPQLIRSWENRHAAVTPSRTPGGTRRYRAEDIERLRLLKAMVDNGNRIGKIASMTTEEIACALDDGKNLYSPNLSQLIAAVERLDAEEIYTLLRFQLSVLGPVDFAHRVGLPLLHEVGRRWENDQLGVAAEHLLASSLRTLMGASLHTRSSTMPRPTVVYATPPDERHEFGLLFAAIVAESTGARVIYLGVDMPLNELISATRKTQARALALSLVSLPQDRATEMIRTLRAEIPADVALLIGGGAANLLPPIQGVEKIERLERMRQRIQLLSSSPV